VSDNLLFTIHKRQLVPLPNCRVCRSYLGSKIAKLLCMANKITVSCGESAIGDVVLCGRCQDVTTPSRGFCLKCGHACVFSLEDALNGRFEELPAILEDTGVSWIASILNELLVARHHASQVASPGNTAA
jgi:hypothetical protein